MAALIEFLVNIPNLMDLTVTATGWTFSRCKRIELVF